VRGSSAALAVALGFAAPSAEALELRLIDRFTWTADDPDFGGFSGLVVTDAGRGLWAVSDHGTLWHAAIDRDAEGDIAGLRVLWHDRFLDNHGKPVSGFTSDSESIAAAPDGGFFIGYESYSRVTGLHPPDMRPVPLHDWQRFKTEWNNTGFEGVARRADGSLLTVVEARDEAQGGYRTYIGRGHDWRGGPILKTAPDFGASDLGIDAAGTLWLLERRLSWLGQFEVRISTCPDADDGAVTCDPVLTVPGGELGNMEGLSLWRDSTGRQFISLISDDNFSLFSSTAIVEYEILP
jgi:hypothetical protein